MKCIEKSVCCVTGTNIVLQVKNKHLKRKQIKNLKKIELHAKIGEQHQGYLLQYCLQKQQKKGGKLNVKQQELS